MLLRAAPDSVPNAPSKGRRSRKPSRQSIKTSVYATTQTRSRQPRVSTLRGKLGYTFAPLAPRQPGGYRRAVLATLAGKNLVAALTLMVPLCNVRHVFHSSETSSIRGPL